VVAGFQDQHPEPILSRAPEECDQGEDAVDKGIGPEQQHERGKGRLGLEEGDHPEHHREEAPEQDPAPVVREFVNHRTLRSGGRALHPLRRAEVPLGAASGGTQLSQRRRGIASLST